MTEFLRNGFKTLITFPSAPTIKLREITVQPFGISGGGAIEQTTMRNDKVHTNAPGALYTMSDAAATFAYDPAAYDDLITMINENQALVITFPDTDTLTVWGWLDEFTPGDNAEHERPEADAVLIASNLDATWTEIEPVRAIATT